LSRRRLPVLLVLDQSRLDDTIAALGGWSLLGFKRSVNERWKSCEERKRSTDYRVDINDNDLENGRPVVLASFL
jgi:hypothetical protein